MPDEVRLFSLLGSWLYGSMIHATGVIGRTFEADLSALRVYGVEGHEHTSFVDTARLGLTTKLDQIVQAWPLQPDTLYEKIKKAGKQQGIYRPADLFNDNATTTAKDSGGSEDKPQDKSAPVLDAEQLKLFEGLGVQIHIQDCLCMSMRVYGEIWAAVALMRIEDSQPFGEAHYAMLKQIKPALVHMLRSGCARQGLTATPKPEGKPGKSGKPLSTNQIISKLTRTECQVLGYLRLATTEREISKEIHRSPHTVHVHVKNIYRKLNVNSRSELMELFGDSLRD